MKILNLSNHKLTEEQINELQTKWKFKVVELDEKDHEISPNNDSLETIRIMDKYEVDAYHVAGFAPAVVCAVNYAKEKGKRSFYAYSERKSVEKQENGRIVKTSIFEHKGFYLY